MVAAKQNQKFPFHFLSAPPPPPPPGKKENKKIFFDFLVGPPPHPAEEKRKGKENFWFLLPRPQGADEARRLERTIQFRATTRSARAKSRVLLEMGSNSFKQTPPPSELPKDWTDFRTGFLCQ